MILRVQPLRFRFKAINPISFPPGKAANLFRGAFGEIFRRIASPDDYARMFEPKADHDGPSGFGDRPRPFVLRAASLDGLQLRAGDSFALDINVFDLRVPALDYFRRTFEQLGQEGLGAGRPRVELTEALELPTIEASLSPQTAPVNRVRIEFLTPTELKIAGATLREPDFEALFKRARDRVTGLVTLYQEPNPPDLPDFRGMGARAALINRTGGQIRQIESERRSTRTGQRHSLGGFIGHADYEGDVAEFLPYLEAAWWTGVGRLTVWGNGLIRTTTPN